MRQALNNNPIVQAAVIGVMALLLAVVLLMNLSGGDEESAPAPAPTAADPSGATSTAPAPAAGASPAPTTEPAPAAPATPATPSAPAPLGAGAAPQLPPPSPEAFTAGRGLPKDVLKAYESNDAIVLLVVRRRGIEDKKVEKSVEGLDGRGDVAVFVTQAKDIARYSRITQGAVVTRVPALVVVRPRKLTDDVPTATVRHGFRGPESIEQTVEDALYEGKNVPYYPK